MIVVAYKKARELHVERLGVEPHITGINFFSKEART